MPNWKKVIISGSDAALTSVIATAGFTGSLLGTASFASTASFITASGVYGPYGSNSVISASHAVNGGVTQLLAGPNITLSPTNGKGQVTISSTGGGGPFFNTATGSYGSFYDTTTQTNPIANIARSMSFNTTDITNGVSISGSTSPFNTYVKTENPGVYNIQFSAQVDKTDSGTDEIVIWLRKNGIDLTDTATTITLSGNNDKQVAAWNWFVNSAANDYYQIIWYSADTDLRLLAETAGGGHPGIPSVIATVNRVDQFLSNTGSFSGSFTGVFTGSLQGTSSWANNATTASYALQALSASFASTASFAPNYVLNSATSSFVTNAQTSSFVQNNQTSSMTVLSASFASTASFAPNYVLNSATGSFVTNSQTSSFVLNSQTSSMSVASASFASTASFVQNAQTASTITVTDTTTGTGPYYVAFTDGTTGARNLRVDSAALTFNATTNTLTTTASYALQALSASFASTVPASGVIGLNLSQIATASFTASVSPTQFTVTSASITEFTVTGTGITIGNAITDTHRVTGSLNISGSVTATSLTSSTALISGSGTNRLIVVGSGSAQPIFTVQGSQGELFSITDSLSGSLFSVNDISGLPILEVFSDNTTLIGSYLDPMLITTTKVTQTNSGSFVVYSLPTASYDTAFFEYSIKSGSNARAGTIMAIQSGTSVNFTETTTTDFGNTTPVSFTVVVTGSNMALTGSSTTGSWTVKTIIRGI